MKILSCHIENFGKIHDYSRDFCDGTNVICEENGWGKSTFVAFIRAMFYGLEGDRKRSIEENERKRYKPWQGVSLEDNLFLKYTEKPIRFPEFLKTKKQMTSLSFGMQRQIFRPKNIPGKSERKFLKLTENLS